MEDQCPNYEIITGLTQPSQASTYEVHMSETMNRGSGIIQMLYVIIMKQTLVLKFIFKTFFDMIWSKMSG